MRGGGHELRLTSNGCGGWRWELKIHLANDFDVWPLGLAAHTEKTMKGRVRVRGPDGVCENFSRRRAVAMFLEPAPG